MFTKAYGAGIHIIVKCFRGLYDILIDVNRLQRMLSTPCFGTDTQSTDHEIDTDNKGQKPSLNRFLFFD